MYELIAEHNPIFKHHYSDLRIASPPDMHIAKQARTRKWRAPLAFLVLFDGSWCNQSMRPSPILAWCLLWPGRASVHHCRRPALRTCTVQSERAHGNGERPGVSRCHSMGLAETDPWDQVPSSLDAWFGRRSSLLTHARCIASARAEMGCAPVFLAVILWFSTWQCNQSVRSSPILVHCVV